MIVKEKALALIQEMPAQFTLDELVEQFIFLEKIEKGMEQIKNGEVISHEEVKKRVQGWRK